MLTNSTSTRAIFSTSTKTFSFWLNYVHTPTESTPFFFGKREKGICFWLWFALGVHAQTACWSIIERAGQPGLFEVCYSVPHPRAARWHSGAHSIQIDSMLPFPLFSNGKWLNHGARINEWARGKKTICHWKWCQFENVFFLAWCSLLKGKRYSNSSLRYLRVCVCVPSTITSAIWIAAVPECENALPFA